MTYLLYFVGQIERKTVEGRSAAYAMYVVRDLGQMFSTAIAVDPDTPKVQRFVTLGGEPELVRYNSRLPLVVYVPEEAEVRYRIWSPRGDGEPMPQG